MWVLPQKRIVGKCVNVSEDVVVLLSPQILNNLLFSSPIGRFSHFQKGSNLSMHEQLNILATHRTRLVSSYFPRMPFSPCWRNDRKTWTNRDSPGFWRDNVCHRNPQPESEVDGQISELSNAPLSQTGHHLQLLGYDMLSNLDTRELVGYWYVCVVLTFLAHLLLQLPLCSTILYRHDSYLLLSQENEVFTHSPHDVAHISTMGTPYLPRFRKT